MKIIFVGKWLKVYHKEIKKLFFLIHLKRIDKELNIFLNVSATGIIDFF